ncbi:MAG: tetratricopeptide repeat protein [Desulfarculus sp.]|nr:tetratricopeptide repeat protein [Pseudomonadota bacterium]MBV1717341.1 tetratricopeptide repeat protein [Desulfarculus sp.]MBU4575093.1 tetratricopeptide repeat protein [Pseudomonadota bacterium]MBU4596928.1 tetratricopeptide repeat protein [Pseudomonadota bacterium]MBV1736949.1 tetratricopeptide repeat protein [Desulfarculus sp.]
MHRFWALVFALALLVFITPLPASSQTLQQPSQADILYNQARFDLLNGDKAKALETLEQAAKINPQDERIAVWRIRVLWVLGREQEALTLCQNLLQAKPAAFSQLHFEAAQVLFGQGQSQKALQHLQAAERYHPDQALRAQMELLLQCERYDQCALVLNKASKAAPKTRQELLIKEAQAQYKNYEYDEALESLNKAKHITRDKAAVKQIEALENEIRITDRPWWLGATAAYIYDSNVFLDPIYEDPAHAVASGKSSSAALGEAWAGYRLARRQGYSFGVTGHVMYMNYFDQSEASYSYWSPGMYLSWGKYRWGWRLPYNFYYYYHTGRMTEWSRIHSLTPSVYWQMTSNLKTYFTGVVLKRQYIDDRSDAMHYGLVIDHVYSFDKASNFVKLSYRLDDEDAEDGISGYKGIEVTLASGWEIWRELSAEAGITYAHYDYDQRPEWTLAYQTFERKDDQMRYYLEFRWQLPDWWNLKLNFYYMDNNSNVESDVNPYNYNKYVIMLAVTKFF